MTHSELVADIAQHTGQSAAEVGRTLACLADRVAAHLKEGTKVQVNGLFVAEAALRGARPGRNPRTGEAITIPAHRAVRITASSTLSKAVRA